MNIACILDMEEPVAVFSHVRFSSLTFCVSLPFRHQYSLRVRQRDTLVPLLFTTSPYLPSAFESHTILALKSHRASKVAWQSVQSLLPSAIPTGTTHPAAAAQFSFHWYPHVWLAHL